MHTGCVTSFGGLRLVGARRKTGGRKILVAAEEGGTGGRSRGAYPSSTRTALRNVMSATILVTGGAGYVGSHACKALARAGYRPITYDSLIHGHREAVRWGPLVEADLADAGRLAETLKRFDVAAVLHFAAFAYVGESVEQPGLYFRNNVANTLTLLEAMRTCAVRHIVFSSTCATYGIPEG